MRSRKARTTAAPELELTLIHADRGDTAQARQNFDRAERERLKLIKEQGQSWDRVTPWGAAMHALYAEASARVGVKLEVEPVPK